MTDVVFDSDEIRRLSNAGWTKAMLAEKFNCTVIGINNCIRGDKHEHYDPTLRARWEARLPAMKAALLDDIGR